MTIGTRIFTWLKGDEVGRDAFGNRYYKEKAVADPTLQRRWVIYQGEPEASKVPPDWHAWLHRLTDAVPAPGQGRPHPWTKEHHPNLTGTPLAYRPPGHQLKGGQRARSTGDYEPWRPS